MRIAWFTPFNVHSAIGEFSRHVTHELAELADVEIWTSDDAPLLQSDVPVVGYRVGSPDLKDLRSRDVIVYNLGNFLGFHGDIYEVARQHAGVVVLHDRALHHLFADMWLAGPEAQQERYLERMTFHYGRDGADAALAVLEGRREPIWEADDDVLRYPLYEEGIANALGVIVHSELQAREIRRAWFGPTAALHLPCYRETLEEALVDVRSDRPSRFRLLTIGHLNPNKQVDGVIEMLVDHPNLAERVEYRVVGADGGSNPYADHVRQLARKHHPALRVEILGWRSDAELAQELAAADIFINLRHPNIEGGSASLMKQLAYGRPIACFDSGAFSELPDGASIRVPVGDFHALAGALEAALDDDGERKRAGEAARAVAVERDEASYAQATLALIERSREAAPGLRLLNTVAEELGAMNVDARLGVFDSIAEDFGRVLASAGQP